MAAKLRRLACVCVCSVAVAAGVRGSARAADSDLCPPALAAAMPERRGDAPTGAEFASTIPAGSGEVRENAIGAALEKGDIPGFLRRLRPVVLGGGGRPRIVLCVTPDYLAIGSDSDFLRIPMGLPTALAVASRFGFVLPTRRIVDAIYAQADVRLAPQPLPAGAAMVSTGYFTHHNAEIEQQRHRTGGRLGALTAGIKKDLVLTRRLWSYPGRVAIYGWHRLGGSAIQPLSTVHGARYADYSHGVRLVSTVVMVDGRRRSIFDVLADPQLAPILSDEGPMPRLGELVGDLGGQPGEPAKARVLAASAATSGRPGLQEASR